MKTILFLGLLLASSAQAAAQDLTVSPVKIWTGSYEMQDPIGLSIGVSTRISLFTLKGEYLFARNERKYFGIPAYGFLVPPLPPEETITSTSRFSAYEFSLAFAIRDLIPAMDISGGIGYSFDSYSADRVGSTTGKKASFQSGSKSGPFIVLSAEYVIISPVSITAGYKIKSLSEGNMATDIELPFAGISTVRELQLGLSYHLY